MKNLHLTKDFEKKTTLISSQIRRRDVDLDSCTLFEGINAKIFCLLCYKIHCVFKSFTVACIQSCLSDEIMKPNIPYLTHYMELDF